MEDELNRLIECLQEHEAEKQNDKGTNNYHRLLDFEVKLIKIQGQLRDKEYYISELEKGMKAKQDTQVSQINALNKDRFSTETQLQDVKAQLKDSQKENITLGRRVEQQDEEIERMNQYIVQIEEEQKDKSFKESQDEEMDEKVNQLERQLSHKDMKYIELMEKLKQSQDQLKSFDQDKKAELSNYISKDAHKQTMNTIQQANNELVKQIKLLNQSLEKNKIEEQKMRKVLDSNPSSPTHQQLVIIKEFNDISSRIMEYDDDDKLKDQRCSVLDVINRVLKEHDSLSINYKMIEEQFIIAKVKYAEAEEIKERLLVQLDTVTGKNNVYKSEKSLTISENDLSLDSRNPDSSTSSSIFAKASSMFSSASNLYSNKFSKNS